MNNPKKIDIQLFGFENNPDMTFEEFENKLTQIRMYT
jgi:hypothetical protein